MDRLHNLTFLQFINLDESIAAAVAGSVEDIDIDNPTTTIRFAVDGVGYGVSFERQDNYMILSDKYGTSLNGSIVKINFMGPRGYSLQKKLGAEGMKVYGELLRIIKAYLLKFPVDSIYFSPAHQDMVPVYNLFYNKFLQPDPPIGGGFLQWSQEEYISKEWIRKHKENLTSNDFWQFVKIRRKQEEEIENVKQRKAQLKNDAKKLPSLVGTLVTDNYRTGVIKSTRFTGSYFEITYVVWNQMLDQFTDETTDYTFFDTLVRRKASYEDAKDFFNLLESKLKSQNQSEKQSAVEVLRLIKPSEYAFYHRQPLTEAIGDIMSSPTTDIHFEKTTIGYKSRFKIASDLGNLVDFTVEMYETPFDIDGNEVENVYEVNLSGPDKYNLTGIMGAKANIVYRNLMLAIKKLMETTEVNGLAFFASQQEMIPIYNLFYSRFLLPDPPAGAGFIQYDLSTYLSKEWIRNHKELVNPWDIIRTGRKNRSIIQRVKSARRLQRRGEE